MRQIADSGATSDAVRIFTPAEGVSDGIPLWKLRTPHRVIPTSGVRSDRPLDGLLEHAQAFAVALPPDCAYSHGTAAQLWGIPVPRRVEGRPVLDVMRDSRHPPLKRARVLSHRGLEHRAVAQREGLRVTSLADTWCDLAAPWLGMRVDDLIIAGDAVCELVARTRFQDELHPGRKPGEREWELDPALRGIRQMLVTLKQRRRHKGKARLLEAFPHLRPRVWSPMETRTRLVIIRAGLPEPLLNAEVHFAGGGGLLMTGDLVWPKQLVMGEYHGADHGSLKARGADSTKRGLAEADGWRVIEVFAHHIFEDRDRAELIRRFAIALGVPFEDVNFLVGW